MRFPLDFLCARLVVVWPFLVAICGALEVLPVVRRSVSVSTSVVSSSHVRPPVGQLVMRSEAARRSEEEGKQATDRDEQAAGKIRDHISQLAPLTVGDLLPMAHSNRPFAQWLRPRRLGDPPPVINELQARQQQSTEQPRGLKSLLRGNILWFGSNLLAAFIPLASLLGLPGLAANHAQVAPLVANQTTRRNSLVNRLVSSLSSLAGGQQLVAALASGAPGGLQSRVEYVMGWLERSVEHLPSFPRLHPQECVKRSICEAHHEPERFGAMGLTLRLLFPASPVNGSEVDMDNLEYKVINKYRHAAGYGLNRRLDNASASTGSHACREKYDDCLVSLLEVGQKLLDFFLK